jgi:hypothetical protein
MDPSAHEMVACCIWGALVLAIVIAVAELLDQGARR